MITKKTRGSLARKKGRFYVIVYYYENGTRRSKSYPTGIPVEAQNKRLSAKSERAAREKMAEILREFQPPSAKPPTAESLFADDVRVWLQHQKNSVASSTYAGYSYATADVIYYFSHIAPIKTVDVTPTHIENYITWERVRRQPGYIPPDGEKKAKTRTTDGAGIDNTIMRRIAVIRSALQSAKRDGRITRNPCAKYDSWVKFPRVQSANFDVLDVNESRILLAALKNEPLWFQLSVQLGLVFGLRRSEIIGLRESDINFSQNTIIIRNTVTQQTIDRKNIITSRPKTKTSKYKSFELPHALAYRLQQLITINHSSEELFGDSYDHSWDTYLFRHPDGILISPNTVTQKFAHFLCSHGLKKIRFHDLRHSCASMLYANGVNPKIIQQILGHSHLATTTDIYMHIFGDEKNQAVSDLSDLLLLPIEESDN